MEKKTCRVYTAAGKPNTNAYAKSRTDRVQSLTNARYTTEAKTELNVRLCGNTSRKNNIVDNLGNPCNIVANPIQCLQSRLESLHTRMRAYTTLFEQDAPLS